MKKLLSLFSVLFLYGCVYTDVYIDEETEIFNDPAEHDYLANVLAVDLMLYPDFTYFRPGYDNPYALLSVISKEPDSIHISKVQFVNVDTGLLHEMIVNETLTLKYSENFNGIPNLERYSSYISLSGEEIYPNFYGALEIEMTVSYSMNGSSNESKTFNLKPVSVKEFILVQ